MTLRWVRRATTTSASFSDAGPSGQAEACHFPPPNQFPAATTGYWVISYPLYGIQQAGAKCPGSQAAAQSAAGLPMLCLGAQGWQEGWFTGAGFFPPRAMTDRPRRPSDRCPRWLRFVTRIRSRRLGVVRRRSASSSRRCSAMLSPWPLVTTVLWWVIALAGLWLGSAGNRDGRRSGAGFAIRRRDTGGLLAHAGELLTGLRVTPRFQSGNDRRL